MWMYSVACARIGRCLCDDQKGLACDIAYDGDENSAPKSYGPGVVDGFMDFFLVPCTVEL